MLVFVLMWILLKAEWKTDSKKEKSRQERRRESSSIWSASSIQTVPFIGRHVPGAEPVPGAGQLVHRECVTRRRERTVTRPVVTEPLARFSCAARAAAALHVTCTHKGNFAFSSVLYITISISLYRTFNNTNGFTDNRKIKGQGKEIVSLQPQSAKVVQKKCLKCLCMITFTLFHLMLLNQALFVSHVVHVTIATVSSSIKAQRHSLSMKSASRPVWASLSLFTATRSSMINCRVLTSGRATSTSSSGLLIWLTRPSAVTDGRYLQNTHTHTRVNITRHTPQLSFRTRSLTCRASVHSSSGPRWWRQRPCVHRYRWCEAALPRIPSWASDAPAAPPPDHSHGSVISINITVLGSGFGDVKFSQRLTSRYRLVPDAVVGFSSAL